MKLSDELIIGAFIKRRSADVISIAEAGKPIEIWTRAEVIEIDGKAVSLRLDDGRTEKRSVGLLTWRQHGGHCGCTVLRGGPPLRWKAETVLAKD